MVRWTMARRKARERPGHGGRSGIKGEEGGRGIITFRQESVKSSHGSQQDIVSRCTAYYLKSELTSLDRNP